MLAKTLEQAGLGDIYEKVLSGERLSFSDGLRLYACPNLSAVGALANILRERKNGNWAYFVRNQHINYTNICNKFCKFCSFYATPKQSNAYTLTPEQIQEKVRQYLDLYVTEIHMVGGVNPRLPYSYYLDILRAIKEVRPDVHIRAFTMVELAEIQRVAKKSLEEVLLDLKSAGLDSIPGGGAEVFSDRIHQELFPLKQRGDEWLEIARTCHRMGLRSNATMLYGHIETPEEKVQHLIRLRELQDETGGFVTYIPLSFHPENTGLSHLLPPTGYQDLRELAVGRLMLDNFDHIKAFWMMMSPAVAQVGLWYGADDIDGTIVEYEIVRADGSATPYRLTREQIIEMILEAGRIPVERDPDYRPVWIPEEFASSVS